MTGALDDLAFHALIGPHAHLAERTGDPPVLRYRPDVTPFHGVEHLDERAWASLGEIAGPDEPVVLLRRVVTPPPPGWEVLFTAVADQYVDGPDVRAAPSPEAVVLGPEDLDEMVALATLTEPGPFRSGALETGRWVGIRRDGRLVAMAGERMRAPGWVELSGVCVHPDARGKGLAVAVVLDVVHHADAAGERVVLHVMLTNAAARALYERLGFAHNGEMAVLVARPATEA